MTRQGGAHNPTGQVTGRAAALRDELIALNTYYRLVTGEDYYLYTSIPGDGQVRVVFADTGAAGVQQGYAAGVVQMMHKLAALPPVHKARPEQGNSRRWLHCGCCGQQIKRVQGGHGFVWVHADSGAVAAPNPPNPVTPTEAQELIMDKIIKENT